VQKTTPDGKRECVIQHAESGSAESVAVVESSKSSFTVEDLTVYAFAAVGLVAVAKVGYSMFPKSTVDYVEVAEI
jgi:hypothetical protein